MADQMKASTEEFQRASKASLDAVLRAWSEAGRVVQTVTSEVTEYSKRAFEDVHLTELGKRGHVRQARLGALGHLGHWGGASKALGDRPGLLC